MDWKELFKFLKQSMWIVAIVVTVYMIVNSGFMHNSVKVDYKDLKIEVAGHEKNTQPLQK